MSEDDGIEDDNNIHEHMCLECGEHIDCPFGEDCEDEFEDSLCTDCMGEQKELLEEENDAL